MPQAVVAVQAFIYGVVGTSAAAVGFSSATAASIAAGAVGIATATAKVALLAGLNAVVANQNKPRPQGGLINLTINPNEPRRLQVGTRINGGVLTDWYIRGPRNQYLYMIVYLGEGPMGRITKVFGGGREVYSTPINHGTRTVIPNYRSGGDRLWITYYDGRPGQSADSYLVSQGVGWTSNHVGTGCAYAIIEAWWDSDNQTTPPSISFEMEGAKLYDRRKDSTAGGSGSHRANDPATWELSTNPAVALDHYLLGRYTGSVKTFGVGLGAADVPYAAFAARANLCDEDVPRKVSGTLKRYAANGFLFADRTYADTIRDLCRAMNARPADFGGRIGIIDGEEKTPVMTLADADVIDAVPENYTPKRSWADLVSVVRGTYQNPAQLYQAGEYPRITDAAWTAADGGSPKEATLDLEMEIDAERAQRLALAFAMRQRRQAQLSGTYALRTIELEQGDWFIRAGGIFGAGKTFEVIDRVLDPRTMTVTLTAFEVDPADSAWDESTAVDPPPAPLSDDNTLLEMEVPALTVTGVTLSGTAAELPAIKVEWDAPDDPRVRQIVIEAVPEAGGVPVSQTVDAGTLMAVFTNGITDDTDYLVRARFVGEFIPSDWTANFEVTTLGDYSVGVASSVPWSGLTGSIPATVDNALVPVGTNLLLQANFNTVATYYQIDISAGSDTRVTGDVNGIRFRESLMTGSPASGTTITHRVPTTTVNMPPVQAGQRISVSCLAGCTNLSSVELIALFYTSGLSFVSQTILQTINTPSLAGGADLTSYSELGGLVTVPATAAHVMLFLRGYCNGGAAPRLRFARPVVAIAGPGQTAVTPWGLGFIGQPGADITATNTAAAITGQGALATLNTANTAQIASGAVSVVSSAYTSGTGGGSAVGDGWTRQQNVTLTSTGGTLLINAALKGVIASDTSNASQSVRIRRGTTTLYDCSPFNQVTSAEDTFSPFSATITDTPAAGTYTYYIETTFGGADISRNEFSNRALVITELKR